MADENPYQQKRQFFVYAIGETAVQIEEQINLMLDQGFQTHGFSFSNNGRIYQLMWKYAPDTVTTSYKAYYDFKKAGLQKPFKPMPPQTPPNG
jgi:hypothetical protein